MADDLKQQILNYMESHNTMTLGTCGENVPWAATVFYASDGLDLYFFSDPQSRHCQNLEGNSKVAVTIQEERYGQRCNCPSLYCEGMQQPRHLDRVRGAPSFFPVFSRGSFYPFWVAWYGGDELIGAASWLTCAAYR